MADWHGMVSKNTTSIAEDFEEEDVWSSSSSSYVGDHHQQKEHYSSGSSSGGSAWRFSTAPRMIRRSANNIPTTTNEANKVVQAVTQSSAPVNIPDWSKIYGKNANFLASSSSRNSSGVDDLDHAVYNGNIRDYYHSGGGGDDDDNEDGDDEGMVPPHEWLAKKLARSQISSFSVCEGVGRTLKGRDLSKVRNAILTKTGFLE